MTTQDALYAADALQFSAVPASALEFLHQQRREALETWLVEQLPRFLKSFVVSLVLLYGAVLLLVTTGPYLVIVVGLFHRMIGFILLPRSQQETFDAFNNAVWIVSAATVIAAVLQRWILPEAWVLALAAPYEVFSTWAKGSSVIDWIVPDYSGPAFLRFYQQTVARLENWLWDWLAFIYGLYFFLARGAMVIVMIVIQVAFIAGTVLALCLAVIIPLHLFMRASDVIKRRLNIEKGRIPVGAFLLYALGECLEFGTETFCRWTALSCG